MADAQASGACYGNIVWVQVPSPALLISDQGVMRKCRNWQTSKTKDLVVVTPCGFKSHLPQEKRQAKTACLFCFYIAIAGPFGPNSPYPSLLRFSSAFIRHIRAAGCLMPNFKKSSGIISIERS